MWEKSSRLAAGVRELLGRRVVGGEHDVLAHDPEPLAEHELGQARAVHAAALVVQQAENGRVRAGLDRIIFLIPRVPLEGALQALRRGDDAAAQLLAPTTIVLVGVIMIIMVAAMTGMSTAI